MEKVKLVLMAVVVFIVSVTGCSVYSSRETGAVNPPSRGGVVDRNSSNDRDGDGVYDDLDEILPSPLSAYRHLYSHAWAAFSKRNCEPPGFGMYTYVLFGGPVDVNLPADVASRYRETLSAIVASQSVGEALGTTDSEAERRSRRSSINLFLLPAKGGFLDSPMLANYDSELGRKYLAEFSRIHSLRAHERHDIFDGYGPYFISVRRPPWEQSNGEGGYFLVADLSDMNPAGIRQLVHGYKEWVVESGRGGVEYFESFSLSVLDGLLDFDRRLALIRTVAADWLIFVHSETK